MMNTLNTLLLRLDPYTVHIACQAALGGLTLGFALARVGEPMSRWLRLGYLMLLVAGLGLLITVVLP